MPRIRNRWFVVSVLSATFVFACAAPPASIGGPAKPEGTAPRAEKRIAYGVAVPIDVRPTASLGGSQPTLPLIGSGLSTRDGHVLSSSGDSSLSNRRLLSSPSSTSE